MLIVPQPDSLTRPYWEGALAGQLKIQQCNCCAHMWHPPLPICPECHARDFKWVAVSGRGIIYSFSVVHHAAHVAMTDRVPYVVALVTLEEGPRVVSNLLHCAPEQISIGMKVAVAFEEIADGIVLPQFQPAGAAVSRPATGRLDTAGVP